MLTAVPVVPLAMPIVPADCRLIAPASVLPIDTAPVLVPVLILVSKLELALRLAMAPVTVRPPVPCIRPLPAVRPTELIRPEVFRVVTPDMAPAVVTSKAELSTLKLPAPL